MKYNTNDFFSCRIKTWLKKMEGKHHFWWITELVWEKHHKKLILSYFEFIFLYGFIFDLNKVHYN